jgi:tRNA U34 5-carboxymethylaminomethyl modifying GTPase MnmE/TrmE
MPAVHVCHRLRLQVSARTAAGFAEVLRTLCGPLQVTLAGRIKSCKSTLVNALIGRQVALTDVGECTRLVTRFQYGTVDRGRVHQRPHEGAAGRRRRDDPGRTVREHRRDRPYRAVANAEAVLYVVTQGVRAADQQALAAFTAATTGREAGPINAIAVLNKADTIAPESVAGSGGDGKKAAALLAEKQAATLKPQVADILPVIGLIADAESGGFTSANAEGTRSSIPC